MTNEYNITRVMFTDFLQQGMRVGAGLELNSAGLHLLNLMSSQTCMTYFLSVSTRVVTV